jgi:diadenosine tetraphosphate (Ap4A) HIT family hydrolase
MKAFRTCRFCNISNGMYQYGQIDEPFSDNEDFMAVASIGALIEGWSLIIPKEHQLSMRNVYGLTGFSEFVGSVIPRLARQYGTLIAFEHGSAKEGSITACGTDHAHLHLVPLGGSLLSGLEESGLQWTHCRPSEIAFRAGVHEYLFYCELRSKPVWQDPVGYLHVLESPISQFFRHLIARRLGQPEAFDYRRFPHLAMAEATRAVLGGSLA